MRNHGGRLLALTLIVLVTSVVASAARPNLTGEWKLNIAKSDLGQMPAPGSMVQKISHEDPNLTVATKMSSERGDFEWESKYTTDGKESVNTIRERTSKSIVKWDADTLLFETKGQFGENDFTMKDKWTVSADGKVLTINRHFSSAMGEGDQTLLFEKQ